MGGVWRLEGPCLRRACHLWLWGDVCGAQRAQRRGSKDGEDKKQIKPNKQKAKKKAQKTTMGEREGREKREAKGKKKKTYINPMRQKAKIPLLRINLDLQAPKKTA